MDFSNLQISFGLNAAKKVGYGVQETEKYPDTPVITISVSKNEKRNVSLFELNRKAMEVAAFQGKNFQSTDELKSEFVMEAVGRDDSGAVKALLIVNVTGNAELSSKAKRFTKSGTFSSGTLFERVVEFFNLDPDGTHEIACEDASNVAGMSGLILQHVIVDETQPEDEGYELANTPYAPEEEVLESEEV
jgi:hypothetical protein